MMIEFKAIPIPPTSSPSDIITVKSGLCISEHLLVLIVKQSNSISHPTQTHNLEASLK